ncbi:acyl-CoA dehydrogenase family protein [Rugosimonospora africana]|uniref:Acyl-CoA dehydrogenase n=1 Tax=Rugosimonospora africana TaxID=556532 RepID=A0A8J3R0X4_9ACTN|nr:acyl-CoA dehydrogenase family protein [Rugosimonospora africana]GIH20176.1 acyl-CoA dehydrogenase [Rugosimonospora africana]
MTTDTRDTTGSPGAAMAGVARLRDRAAELLPAVGAGAAARERSRELPYAQIRQIARSQLVTFRIPTSHAGPGSAVRDVMRFVVDLAAIDSNIAQALRSSFGFVESLLANGSADERDTWFPRLLAGDIVANAGWEIGVPNGEIRTRITRQGDHFIVEGSKFYRTGALYADWIGATALDESAQRVSFILPRGRDGLRLVDDFDGMGQRFTASGTTRFDNVVVHSDELRRGPTRNRRSPVTAFLQLYLGAVEAGIARNALTDAVAFARRYARPIAHSTAERAVDDPYVQHAVGEISAHAYVAEAAVDRAAATIDRAWDADLRPDLLTAASVEVAQAQFVAVNAALRAAELVFDVGGGSATASGHGLDRHWRNARTVASHNPRSWKAAVVGVYRLSGAEPPTSGLF